MYTSRQLLQVFPHFCWFNNFLCRLCVVRHFFNGILDSLLCFFRSFLPIPPLHSSSNLPWQNFRLFGRHKVNFCLLFFHEQKFAISSSCVTHRKSVSNHKSHILTLHSCAFHSCFFSQCVKSISFSKAHLDNVEGPKEGHNPSVGVMAFHNFCDVPWSCLIDRRLDDTATHCWAHRTAMPQHWDPFLLPLPDQMETSLLATHSINSSMHFLSILKFFSVPLRHHQCQLNGAVASDSFFDSATGF